MKKLFSLITITFIISLIFFLPSAFANNMVNDAANGVRNAVGGAENAVEETAKGTAGAVKNGFNNMGNATENTMNNVKNDADKMKNNASNNDGYTATRTNAETNNGFLGFTGNNVWTWIVVAIVALIVIGLIWYFMANRNNYDNHNND